MRLVALADTHTFQEELLPVPEGDVLIHAGDLCRGGRLEELRPVAGWLQSLPHRHKIVVAGNHDWCFTRELQAAKEILGPTITYLQESEIAVEGVRFWGSPWQPTFHDWAFNLPRGGELARKWALIPDGIQVLITHGPPWGIGDRCDDLERAGCEELLKAVQRVRPWLHLFGHIHPDGGFWREQGIAYANVTTWECEREATVIDVDVASGKVIPIQVPVAEKPRAR
jgi:predicted phosphohydrolase